MCTCNGICSCHGSTSTGVGSFLLALVGAALWWLLRELAALLRLALAGLVALAIWASPRAWRPLRRAVRGAVRHYQALRLAVVVEEYPLPLAIDTKPHGHLLWSEINKESTR